jgi:hypothetical protein
LPPANRLFAHRENASSQARSRFSEPNNQPATTNHTAMKTTRRPAFVNTSAVSLRASAFAEAIADKSARRVGEPGEHTERTEMESNQPSVPSVASCSNRIAATPYKTKVPNLVWRHYSMLGVC